MTDHAIISGTFADLKIVKTRSIIQVIIELPLENAKLVTDALGWPQPGAELPVAVARLGTTIVEPKGKRGSLAQQAGILCSEKIFQTFLAEKYSYIGPRDGVINDIDAAIMVREICEVESRAEFDRDEAAGQRWKDVKARYEAWKLL